MKYYAVVKGRKPGIYTSWDECKTQIDKFSGAIYKKLNATNLSDAQIEFDNYKQENLSLISEHLKDNTGVISSGSKPIEGVLTVDGASNGLTCEFQAVWYPSREKAFSSKQFTLGTNNIAEFLAIVSAIKYLNDRKLPINIYTDSQTAISWIKNKKANTTARNTGKITDELNKLLTKAENYLHNNPNVLNNTTILKWDTSNWGEIPADFGRK